MELEPRLPRIPNPTLTVANSPTSNSLEDKKYELYWSFPLRVAKKEYAMRFLPRASRARNPFVRYFTPVVLLLILAQSASANTFNVNSTADIVHPPAGVVTLRSAIQSANAISGGNTINLTVAGVYKITLPGANTGTNASGAFVILPGGGNLTIVNTSGGVVVIDGNKLDRVFDINPSASSSPAFTVTMHGFTITNGLAQPGDTAPGSGGGIRAQSVVSVALTDMIVTGNEATADGGGIAMENAVNSAWTLTINNSTISNNHAGDAGGGIDTDGAGSIVINSGTVISGNTSLNQGGGIFLDAIQSGAVFQGANLTMQATVVSENRALGSLASGGGIANAGNGTVSIANSTVQNNSSGNLGGGFDDVNCQGTLSVSSSAFLGNTALNNAGAIADCGPMTSIAFSEIDGNSTGGVGGGIFATGTTLTVQNSTIANNTASLNGGGIELQTSGSGGGASSVTNSTITNNTADNNAGANGGGLDAPGAFTGTLNLSSVTISGNYASNGGGLFWGGASGSATNLVNTIVAKNSASTGPDANNPAATFTDGGGNLIGIAGAGSGNTGFTDATTQTGTPASPLDPLLGPLQNNGGRTQTLGLLTGSPAIEKGLTTSVTADQRGVRRPQGAKFDVGAYEFNQGPTPSADLSTLSLDFGSQGRGTSSSQPLTIADNGTAGLILSNVAISGPNASDFVFTPPSTCVTLPATLQPGHLCRYTVTFSPLAAGTRTAVFTFTDNHLNAPNSQQTVALSGAGIIKANSTVSLALTKGTNPSVFGASLTFTATVTPNTATGSVTFFDGATIIGIAFVSGGAASFTTSSLASGSHSMTAQYSGDTFDNSAASAALPHQVLAVTSTSLAASLNPTVFGQGATFTATVTSATPGTITGTVTFKDGAAVLGSGIVSSGKATLSTSTLTVGVHSITAVYSGNATYAASTSPVLSHTVNKAASSTTVSSSHHPSVFGQSVTFTATVAAISPGSGTPAGTVTFKNGAAVLGSGTLISGKATFSTSALTVGAHSVTATYNGSIDYNTSTSAVLTQTVNKAATSTMLTSTPNPSTLGQTVTFKVTVATLAPGSGTPTGSVKLKDGATELQTASLASGKATFTISSLTHGSHSMTAEYLGSANDLGSTSAVTKQTVN